LQGGRNPENCPVGMGQTAKKGLVAGE